jgi:hypothetical protein
MAARAIDLAALPKDEQLRVLDRARRTLEAKLMRADPGIAGVSIGRRSRRQRLHARSGLVLKVWVRTKLDAPARPVPACVRQRATVRLRDGKAVRAVVSIATDVVPLGDIGTPHGVGAALRARTDAGAVRGCFAARTRWNSRVTWVSAGHVLTATAKTSSLTATTTVQPLSTGADLGDSEPATCWQRDFESELAVDGGLCFESDFGAVDRTWIAGTFGKAMAENDVANFNRYWFASQDDAEVALSFHTMVPADTHAFQLAPGLVRRYPRFMHFLGASAPGDSGTAVYKNVGAGRWLAGVLVGDIRIDGIPGVAAISFQRLELAIATATGHAVALAPL